MKKKKNSIPKVTKTQSLVRIKTNIIRTLLRVNRPKTIIDRPHIRTWRVSAAVLNTDRNVLKPVIYFIISYLDNIVQKNK